MQTRRIAENKSKQLDCLLMHGMMVFSPIAIVMVILSKTGPISGILCAIAYTLMHMAQDQVIWQYFEHKAIAGRWEMWGPTFNKWFFKILGLDQMLHMIVLFVVAYIFIT
jgi:hypothetical protein